MTRGALGRLGGAVATATLLALGVGLLAAPAQAAVVPLPSPSSGTGLGVRLLDAPVDRQDDPRAKTYIVDQVRPGTSFTRRIEIRNDSATDMSLLVYPAPATITGGDFTVGARGEQGTLPPWVSAAPDSVAVPAGGTAQVAVVVRVPATAPTGEVLGAIVVERPPPPGGSGIGVALRVAVRMYLSVGPGAEPVSDLSVDTLVPGRTGAGAPTVTARVTNIGGRALDLVGALTLSDGPAGLSAGPVPASRPLTLAPGQSGDLLVELAAALPAGPWTARLRATSGRLDRSVEARLTFPTSSGVSATPVVPEEVGVGGSWLLLVASGALALVVALVLLVLWRRRPVSGPEHGR